MLHIALALAALAAGASTQSVPQSSSRVRFLAATPGGAGTATLQVVNGGTGAAIPWPTDEIAWYFLRSEGYQENHDRIAPAKRGDTLVTVPPAASGVTMVGVDFRQTIEVQTAGELRAWLRGEGFNAAADSLAKYADQRPLRVRWRASAKVLLRPADDSPEPSEIAMSKSGQQAEIRLWADGTLAVAGDDIPLKLYADGDKLPSVDLRVWFNGAAATSLRADGAGVANLTVTGGGAWCLAAAGIRVLAEDAAAEIEVYVATVTFENGPKGGAR